MEQERGRSKRIKMSTDKKNATGRKTLTPRRKKKEEPPVFKYVGPEQSYPTIHAAITSDKLEHNGLLYHLGDVIRVISETNQSYFGIIQRFWGDQYAEKYVRLQWLIPKEDISEDGSTFQRLKYRIGPIHPELINIRSIGYVMHAKDIGAADDSPAFNTQGELAVMFGTNIPEKTSVTLKY